MTLHFECNGIKVATYNTTWQVEYGQVTMIDGIQYRVVGYDDVTSTVKLIEE